MMFKSILIAVLFSAPSAVIAGSAHDLIESHDATTQYRAFAQVIESAGERCNAVSQVSYLGDSPDGAAGYWTVRCNTEDFIVSLANTSRMASTILTCQKAALVGAKCWVPFR